MRYHQFFEEKLGCRSSEEVFKYLLFTLKDTITNWDYFVNWSKARNGTRRHEINLNLLNFLIGKDNIEDEALLLLKEHPQVIETIPLLLACRDQTFNILTDYRSGSFEYDCFDFSSCQLSSPEKSLEFLLKSGFLEQLRNRQIKSLVDYVFGVEVGLDSNGRKNRGGDAMEQIVHFFINGICQSQQLSYMNQATAVKVKQEWGFDITVDKSTRRIDFAIKRAEKLFFIETNFYSGGGSKLKSTAAEYRTLHRCLAADGHQFIWITDGAGWRTTERPLAEAFENTDYIINLNMVEKGLLSDLIYL
jgi:type II restriction enzyme